MAVLRPYQKFASDAVINWFQNNSEPCLVEAITGSGKSHMCQDIASRLAKETKLKILVVVPSKELCQQNHDKYGAKASIYCASISKSLREQVIFATPLSIKPVCKRLQVDTVILDEADAMLTTTCRQLIQDLQNTNPDLKIVGMTATPYRLGEGFIYRKDLPSRTVTTDAKRPFFDALVYRVDPHELLSAGHISPINVLPVDTSGYDTSQLEIRSGRYTVESVNKTFVGHGRKTAAIIADVVKHSVECMAVVIFASTVDHAHEIMASMPHGTELITGSTKRADRDDIIQRFRTRKFKYLVNVAVLLVGFDAPHIEMIAILRATESPRLLTQLIGRGMRIHPDKTECKILDYAGSIDKHFPDGDLFNPKVSVSRDSQSQIIPVKCPKCLTENEMSARHNPEDYGLSDDGYFTDLDGNIIVGDFGAIPSHHGRRCGGLSLFSYDRCDYWWTSKPCPKCEEPNDIAARRCYKCKAEIIDPNAKLVGEYIPPSTRQTGEVKSVKIKTVYSKGLEIAEIKLKNRTVTLLLNRMDPVKAASFHAANAAGIKTIDYQRVGKYWEIYEYETDD